MSRVARGTYGGGEAPVDGSDDPREAEAEENVDAAKRGVRRRRIGGE